jgi:hypothetical protein
MEESHKASGVVLLRPRKLTPDRIEELPFQERKAYIRALTAKEMGDFFIEHLNNNIREQN